MYKARFNKSGNVKLGISMWTFSKLMGADIVETTKYGSVMGSCSKFCDGCSDSCYVKKSYRYDTVKNGHARNTLAFRDDLFGAFQDLEKQITRARKKPAIIRINQSGEIESSVEFISWCNLARRHPETIFYIYSKAFEYIIDYICLMPENMTLLCSVWHEYGLTEYNRIANYSNVKAFIYCDEYNYNMPVQAMCPAYGKDGKMDHTHTCESCGLCFRGSCKTVGCYDH